MSEQTQYQTTRWWFVRHAPVVDAKSAKLSGQADVAADVSDGESFKRIADQLPQGAVWITTPLKRTSQTAEALWAAGAERVQPEVEGAFVEQAFGAWTGLTWTEIDALQSAESKTFWNAPAITCPPVSAQFGAESFASVCERVAGRLDELMEAHGGHDIICVAHAGSIRGAIAHALGLSPDQALALDVKNTSLTRLDHVTDILRTKRGGSWRVVGVNMI